MKSHLNASKPVSTKISMLSDNPPSEKSLGFEYRVVLSKTTSSRSEQGTSKKHKTAKRRCPGRRQQNTLKCNSKNCHEPSNIPGAGVWGEGPFPSQHNEQ